MGEKEDVIQHKIGGPFETITSPPEVIALFTTEKLANDYITNSRLKHIIERTYAPDIFFRQKSLLRLYVRAWVEEYHEEDHVIDPTL